VLVLLLLIPGLWMAALFFGLAICRLARMSDESQTRALAEWFAMSVDATERHLPGEEDEAAYRATG
jgi:hypothetical protein